MTDLEWEISDQISIMKTRYLHPESIRLDTFKQMTILLELFLKYIQEQTGSKKSKIKVKAKV